MIEIKGVIIGTDYIFYCGTYKKEKKEDWEKCGAYQT